MDNGGHKSGWPNIGGGGGGTGSSHSQSFGSGSNFELRGNSATYTAASSVSQLVQQVNGVN